VKSNLEADCNTALTDVAEASNANFVVRVAQGILCLRQLPLDRAVSPASIALHFRDRNVNQ